MQRTSQCVAIASCVICLFLGPLDNSARPFSQVPKAKNAKSGFAPTAFVGQRFTANSGNSRGRASQAVVLPNQAAAALGFFGNLRMTASLLTGAALGQLGALAGTGPSGKMGQRMASLVHLLGISLTVVQCVIVIFLCTMGTTSVLTGQIDTHAASANALLTGAMELEYVSCRALFLTSLVVFLFATAAKMLGATLALDAKTEEGKRTVGLASTCMLLGGTFWQLAYANKMVAATYGNLAGLYLRAVVLWFQHLGPFSGIAALSSWTLALCGIALCVKTFLVNIRD